MSSNGNKSAIIPYEKNGMRGLCVEGMENLDLHTIPFDNTLQRTQPPWRLEKATRSRCTMSFEMAFREKNNRIFAKRYHTWRWLKKIEYLIYPPKAFREWRAGLQLLEKGIKTPLPLLYAVEKEGLFVKNNYLVTLSIEPDVPVSQLLGNMMENEKRRLIIQSLGEFIRKVHGIHFYHDDLSMDHIYITSEFREPLEFSLIDLDNSRFGSAYLRSYSAMNLFQILRSVDENILSLNERRLLIESYLGDSKTQTYKHFINQINSHSMRKVGRKVI